MKEKLLLLLASHECALSTTSLSWVDMIHTQVWAPVSGKVRTAGWDWSVTEVLTAIRGAAPTCVLEPSLTRTKALLPSRAAKTCWASIKHPQSSLHFTKHGPQWPCGLNMMGLIFAMEEDEAWRGHVARHCLSTWPGPVLGPWLSHREWVCWWLP